MKSISESSNYSYSTIMVDVHHYVDLKVNTTTKHNDFTVVDVQAGEYSQAVIFKSSVSNDTLYIEDFKNPLFTLPQDKLSAHKITDSKVILKIPRNKNVFFNLDNANVEILGNYKNIIANIQNGSLNFKNTSGDIKIITVNADVKTTRLKDYRFEVSSRNGTSKVPSKFVNETFLFEAETINGDIFIN